MNCRGPRPFVQRKLWAQKGVTYGVSVRKNPARPPDHPFMVVVLCNACAEEGKKIYINIAVWSMFDHLR